LGSNCKIGKNCKIINSIIDKNVTIKDGCSIVNSLIMAGVEVQANAKILDHTMISEGVVVKEGVVIPAGSICSLFTYDTENKEFVETDQISPELFVKGKLAYIPRELQLKDTELLGACSPYNQEESDLDVSDEESDVDPLEEFSQELSDLFSNCL